MFVSSYSTYITSNTSDKIAKVQNNRTSENSSFSSKLTTKQNLNLSTIHNPPINYISANKALVNKQELDYQRDLKKDKEIKNTKDLATSFSKQSSLSSLKSTYTTNVTMFSFLRKPKATLDQTPRTDETQAPDIQKIQEQNLRHKMVNTYISNDSYYRVTAS